MCASPDKAKATWPHQGRKVQARPIMAVLSQLCQATLGQARPENARPSMVRPYVAQLDWPGSIRLAHLDLAKFGLVTPCFARMDGEKETCQ